jgi:hypothetical protein
MTYYFVPHVAGELVYALMRNLTSALSILTREKPWLRAPSSALHARNDNPALLAIERARLASALSAVKGLSALRLSRISISVVRVILGRPESNHLLGADATAGKRYRHDQWTPITRSMHRHRRYPTIITCRGMLRKSSTRCALPQYGAGVTGPPSSTCIARLVSQAPFAPLRAGCLAFAIPAPGV